MTKDEAITAVKEVTGMSLPWDDRHYEALQMAIEALNLFADPGKKASAEGQHKKDLISKTDVCEILADVFPTDGEKVVYVEKIENAYQEIIALPYTQPDVPDIYAGDMIYRQAAVDALAKAMPSLTTPDGSGEFDHDIQITDEAFVDCMQIINELPSARPEIIRCKDCKYADDDGVCQNSIGLVIQDDDDFCSRAERRADE